MGCEARQPSSRSAQVERLFFPLKIGFAVRMTKKFKFKSPDFPSKAINFKKTTYINSKTY